AGLLDAVEAALSRPHLSAAGLLDAVATKLAGASTLHVDRPPNASVHAAARTDRGQALHRAVGAVGQRVERCGGRLDVLDRDRARLQREAAEPAHGGALEAVVIAHQQADAQRVLEADARHVGRERADAG